MISFLVLFNPNDFCIEFLKNFQGIFFPLIKLRKFFSFTTTIMVIEYTFDLASSRYTNNQFLFSKEVDLNHSQLTKIENLEFLEKVEVLCLRWNLIKRIENLHMLTTLRELELYDNQIQVIENLSSLTNLEVLDISFNRIRKIENLEP
ncbi:Protein phosphatase 1 regulatory subunit 7 [Armadillidium vulgare]|nr:Protein phosphatase 1 regulatory subunit 7 [Armadillidium vulgare]